MIKNLKTFILLNFIFSIFLFSFYPIFSTSSLKELAFLVPAGISTIFFIYIIMTILILPLKRIHIEKYFSIFLFSLLHLTTIIDIIIYKIFKFHLNSMVLNLILTPGGFQTLDQGIITKILFAILIFILIFLESLFLRLSYKIKVKKMKVFVYLIIICVLMDKTLSAYATISDIVWITQNMQVFPLYQPLKIRSFAEKYLGIKAEREFIPPKTRNSILNYPIREIQISQPNTPNILILVIDSLRFDMFNNEIMPETFAFAIREKAFIFKNHFSGGNATRFGIFSMIYGLYGNYWFNILNERRSPVLIDILQKLNYDIGIFAATRITYPEFDRTCFVKILYANIYDRPHGNKIEKDKKINEKVIEFIKQKRNRPFFAFTFYDSPHGSYDYPENMEKFKPSAKSFNHILLNPSNIEPVFNRYKNSVYFCDFLVGQIIKTLKEQNLTKNTLILITGDHGEPFFETGYYGHNQNYSNYEIKVPLIFYIPGKKGQEIDLNTSHLDIPPTLMNILGVKNPDSDYSHGISLLKNEDLKNRSFLTAFSWDTAAIITFDYTYVFPTKNYIYGGVKIYNSNFKEIKDKNTKNNFNILFSEFFRQYSSFYK